MTAFEVFPMLEQYDLNFSAWLFLILQATVAIFSLSHFALAFFFDSDTGIASPLSVWECGGGCVKCVPLSYHPHYSIVAQEKNTPGIHFPGAFRYSSFLYSTISPGWQSSKQQIVSIVFHDTSSPCRSCVKYD